jgi:hypothetical protein
MPLIHQDFAIQTANGYTWVRLDGHEADLIGESQWMLAELLPTRDARPGQSYRPFRDFTGLFMTLAETSPTREGVLDFTQRFGALADLFPIAPAVERPSTRLDSPPAAKNAAG